MKKRRHRRIYLLGQEIISSKDCGGFVHTARKDHKDVYGDTIEKGEKLVRFNNWLMGNEVISLEDYVRDHDDGKGVILGVRCGKARGRWGVLKNAVVCDRFFKADIESVMTKIPILEHPNDGWNTENLRQCKNCGHWIYYWSIDVPLYPKGWYHYNKLYNPRVSQTLQNKNRRRCFGHDIVTTDKGGKRVLCTCTNPEPDPDGKTWEQVHGGIE